LVIPGYDQPACRQTGNPELTILVLRVKPEENTVGIAAP